MSKQEQIEELKKALAEAEVNENKLRDRANKLEADRRADAETAKSYAGIVEGAAKLAREQEALDLLKLGYVKVETLRGMVSAEYEVNGSPSIDITKFTLRLKSTDRVENALLVAILEKDKPKFATGGYINKPWHGHGTNWHASDSWTTKINFPPVTRPGSFDLVWGNDL